MQIANPRHQNRLWSLYGRDDGLGGRGGSRTSPYDASLWMDVPSAEAPAYAGMTGEAGFPPLSGGNVRRTKGGRFRQTRLQQTD